MTESNDHGTPTVPWPPVLLDLIDYAEREMERLHYEWATIYGYRWGWKQLAKFAEREGRLGPLTDALIKDWLSAEGYPVGQWPTPHPNRLKVLLRCLRILVHVQECRTILPGHVLAPVYRFIQANQMPGTRTLTVLGSSAGEVRVAQLPPAFRDAYLAYEQDCRHRGYRQTTLLNAQRYLPRWLDYLAAQGITEVGSITAMHISTFLTSLQGYAPRTVAHYSCHARCLLRFCYQHGMIREDLSRCVPPTPIRHYTRIPTVWTQEEVETLLAQVDRGSPRGKRDYAILLLAARIGLRVGDIIRLTLDDLKWEQKRIELIQSKTGQPLVVPLLDDLGWALIEYLKHARPVSRYRQVFLRLFPPYTPFVSHDNLYYIITRYRRMAGIQRFQHQPVGLHTLRHSLATQLLTESTPLNTISEVLGHACQTSTEVYAKVDLRHLQQCPLDPEEVCHASC